VPSRRIFFLATLIAVSAWLGAGIYLGEIMLRLPRKPLPPQPRWSLTPPEAVEIAASDGVTLRGWYFGAPKPNGRAVIVLHGQTDNRMGVAGFAEFLVRHGYTALTPDIRAHGVSGGELATYGFLEADDTRRWVDWLLARQPGAQVFGLGESMGAGILLQTLNVESRFCAVVAEGPYANLRDIAYDRLSQRWGSSLSSFALRPVLNLALVYQRLRYGVDLGAVSPEQAVTRTRTRVLLIHGALDNNTPLQHSRSIYRANPGTVTLWEVPGAGHTGAWGSHPQEFERRMLEWLSPATCR